MTPQILDAGYNFDFIDDGAIAHGGVPYPILILPAVHRIPLGTYRKLAEYAARGGILVATGSAPTEAPGLMDAADTPQIMDLSHKLFQTVGGGHLVSDIATLGAVLHAALPADVAAAPEIAAVHRKLAFADLYFIVNTSNHLVRSHAAFRVKGLYAQWWDPFTGTATDAGGANLELALAPYESRVLVFSKERAPSRTTPAGPAPAPIELNGPWRVAFGGESQPLTSNTLHSWNDDEVHRYFSGQATYTTTVTVPREMIGSGHGVYLDFGEGTPVATAEHHSGSGMRAMLEGPVREAAKVYINDKLAGSVWCPPYEVAVGDALHTGANELRVVVANLAINALAKGPLPDYRALNARYGERFQPQDIRALKPLPSGLPGSVRLVAR